MKIFEQLLASPTLIGLSIALLICSSISIFDVRITQAKKAGNLPPDHPELPQWVGVFHILDWIFQIALLILNWKVGILVWVTLFIMKILPVLETIGNILMSPFKRTAR